MSGRLACKPRPLNRCILFVPKNWKKYLGVREYVQVFCILIDFKIFFWVDGISPFFVSVSLNSVIAVLDADFHSLSSTQHRQQYGPVCVIELLPNPCLMFSKGSYHHHRRYWVCVFHGTYCCLSVESAFLQHPQHYQNLSIMFRLHRGEKLYCQLFINPHE